MAPQRIGFIAALILTLLIGGGKAPVRAQAPAQVGIVVQYDEDRVQTYCVALDGPAPSGYDALVLAGPPVLASVSAQGVAVCQIGETGCPTTNCFCQCRGAACNYWAYFHLHDGVWQASNVGAGSHRVAHGDVEGWRWGPGDPPSIIGFEQICRASDEFAEETSPASGAKSPRSVPGLAPLAIAIAAAALALAAGRRKQPD